MHKAKRAAWAILGLGVIISGWLGAESSGGVDAEALERHEYRKLVMGTVARVVLYAPDEAHAKRAAARAFERLVELDERLSHWKPESELSRLVLDGRTNAVSPDLARVLGAALAIAARTEGAFDPVLGRFLEAGRPRARTDDAGPESRLFERLTLTDGRLTTQGAVAGELDLGAIAKGFAADRALDVLREHGVDRALVEIGGDLALGAAPPDAAGWRVRIGEDECLELAHVGVATSGDTERHLDLAGVRYSHVIDPALGRGVTHGLTTTVVAANGMLADALATAASVRGGAFVEARYPNVRVLERRPGFVELFDGESLAGWTTTGGRYDGGALWSVEDGAIVGRTGPEGEGGLLYTEDEYASGEFECEVRMDWPFDSGVFLRMVPPGGGKGLQVTLDARDGGEVGAVYADGFLAHSDGARHWKRDAWNHVRVRWHGFEARLEAWVNGERVTDYTMRPGLDGFAPTGRIGIQVHPAAEGKVEAARFRALRVKRLPMFGDDVFEPVPAPDSQANDRVRPRAGSTWRALFDGATLDGWETVGSSGDYRVEDGALVVPAEGSGWIRTVASFQDFRLRVDFRMAEMANSGLALRATRDDADPAYSGMEIQILDDFHWEERTGTRLAPYQFTGGLYGAVPNLDRAALRPIGNWNTYEVLARGDRIACALNGRVLWDVRTNELEVDPPFAERAESGCIGFQRYGAPLVTNPTAAWFRNVHLEPLSD
ncbi:MAG: family 16 glycoside hydrolase [Planctomycetota bacterium]